MMAERRGTREDEERRGPREIGFVQNSLFSTPLVT